MGLGIFVLDQAISIGVHDRFPLLWKMSFKPYRHLDEERGEIYGCKGNMSIDFSSYRRRKDGKGFLSYTLSIGYR